MQLGAKRLEIVVRDLGAGLTVAGERAGGRRIPTEEVYLLGS